MRAPRNPFQYAIVRVVPDIARGECVNAAVVLKEQTMRDERDRSREHSPLAPAADAVPVDTTGLSLAEVVEQIVTLAIEAKELET